MRAVTPTRVFPEGCAGDGRADDSLPFARALAEAEARGLPLTLHDSARYFLPRWRGFASARPLAIIGNGARLLAPPVPSTFLAPGARVTLTGLSFSGWRSVIERRIEAGGDLSGTRVEDLAITNACGISINVECPIHDFAFRRVSIENSVAPWALRVGTNDRRFQDTWSEGVVESVRIRRSRGAGAVGGALLYGRRIDVIDFDAEDILSGISLDDRQDGACWGLYVKLRDSRIVRPRITNIRAGRLGAECVALNLKGGERVPNDSASPQGFGVTVTAPWVRNFVGLAIRIQNSTTTVEKADLTGVGTLITIDSPYAAREIRVIGGRGVLTGDTGQPGSGIGISIEGALDDVLVRDFDMEGVRIAWRIAPAGQPGEGGVRRVRIDGGVATVRSGGVPGGDASRYTAGLVLSAFRPIASVTLRGVRLRGSATWGIIDNALPSPINKLQIEDSNFSSALAPSNRRLPPGSIVLRSTGF